MAIGDKEKTFRDLGSRFVVSVVSVLQNDVPL